MDIQNFYKEFSEAGKQPCRMGDPQRGYKMRRYRNAKQRLFEALKAEYLSARLCSNIADEITHTISECLQDPESFWGSAKAARTNQAIFVHEKNERLFEELLQCWLKRSPHE